MQFQLPAWRPGRYELANFAQNIQKWKAFDENNNSLPASEAEIKLIIDMSEKLGIEIADVLAMADLAEISEVSKSDASKIITNLKSLRKKSRKK